MERALDLIDEQVRDVYKLDILSAMRMLKRVWIELPDSVIRNFWKHVEIISTSVGVSTGVSDSSIVSMYLHILAN